MTGLTLFLTWTFGILVGMIGTWAMHTYAHPDCPGIKMQDEDEDEDGDVDDDQRAEVEGPEHHLQVQLHHIQRNVEASESTIAELRAEVARLTAENERLSGNRVAERVMP